jgi:apolipoprotein N-acyltransferase
MGGIFKKWAGNRYAQAAGAGLLLAAAYPTVRVAGLAWLAPGLLLLASMAKGGGRVFRLGYVGGLVFWAASLHWLLYIPVAFAPILGWLALSAYLALYQGVWTWACWRLFPGSLPEDAPGGPNRAEAMLAAGRGSRAVWALACGVLWVALEMVRARLLTGFPWNLLGTSQYELLPLVQFASVAGVCGISFLMVWVSVALLMAGLLVARHPAKRPLLMLDLAAPAAVLVGVWVWGAAQLWAKLEKPPTAEIKLALVQPAVPQTLIWDGRENEYRFQKLLELSRAALAHQPDVLVWPEAALPEMLRYDTNTFNAITNLARSHKVWMMVGSDDAEPVAGEDKVAYFNSVFLVSPQGEVLNRYSKRHLVIFGEYVPLARWLPFLKKLTPVGEGFTPGPGPVPFRFRVAQPEGEPLAVEAAVLVCFEDVFAGLACEAVGPDTDFIMNLTNDGWFRESAAQYQHAANAVFRAVETGRPLVRCTNNGRTCWADASGGIRKLEEFFAGSRADVYAEGYKIARVPLRQGAGSSTFYQRHGDWFGWACVAVSVLLLAGTWVRRGNGHGTWKNEP